MEMTQLKDKILTLIENSKLGTYDIEKLAKELDCTSTSDFIMLNKTLNQLEDDYIIARNPKNFFLTAIQAGIYVGKISINRKGFGFLDLDADNSIYISLDDLKGAMDKDEVVVKLFKIGSNEGEVVKILTRNTEVCIGTFYVRKTGITVELDDERLKGRIIVRNLAKFRVVSGTKAQFKIIKILKNTIELEITQLLGHRDDPGVDVLSILLQHDIHNEFPDEALKQAEAISQEVLPEQKIGRRDCTNMIVVTIDGDDSKDFDDAISIAAEDKNYRLWVHIADVSYYVTENSPLDVEAVSRGTSTYVTDRVVPMLPHVLSNGICSLNPKVERLTITCEMLIDENGEVTSYEIYPSYIRSTERMTYNNVNKILAKDEILCRKYEHLGDLFLMMENCAKRIRKNREKNGAIDFDKEEAKIIVDKSGKVQDIQLRERGESERIIEDFMICANVTVAKHMKWLEIPSLYRVHEQPLAKKLREFAKVALIMGHKFKGNMEDIRPLEVQKCLNEFKDEPEFPVISTLMLRSMQKAKYDSKCLGHFGLALDEYLHFTSPIRRYPDLIVHRMLRKYSFNQCLDVNEIKNDELKMEKLGLETSERERASIEAERDVEDMKKAEFMQNKIGLTFDAVISSVTKFGFFVELPNTVEGLVHVQSLNDDYYHYDETGYQLIGERTGTIYKLGQEVRVKLIDANKEKQTIDFIIHKDKKKKKQRWI
ncbi:ribonuclease R [Anaerorhabdus sp.]|uniref:ribonuclease R n=1 Tax=Anaerorhabdus sp. TaxID=1872524 RepID=UPI002FC64B86